MSRDLLMVVVPLDDVDPAFWPKSNRPWVLSPGCA
jgi:hypothetical protein